MLLPLQPFGQKRSSVIAQVHLASGESAFLPGLLRRQREQLCSDRTDGTEAPLPKLFFPRVILNLKISR